MERNENGTPVFPQPKKGNGTAPLNNGTANGGENGAQKIMHGTCRAGENGIQRTDTCLDSLPLAYAYVPWQKWQMLYKPQDALMAGTMFEELDKPLGVYGNE